MRREDHLSSYCIGRGEKLRAGPGKNLSRLCVTLVRWGVVCFASGCRRMLHSVVACRAALWSASAMLGKMMAGITIEEAKEDKK